ALDQELEIRTISERRAVYEENENRYFDLRSSFREYKVGVFKAQVRCNKMLKKVNGKVGSFGSSEISLAMNEKEEFGKDLKVLRCT
ncbi:hypothetical protein AVEN_94043-1, partial [Araneus ventricosus]